MTATAERLFSIERGSSARAVGRLLSVLFVDAATVLDATYGKGNFWDGSAHVRVIGLDMNPDLRPHVRGDFTHLPFADASVDVTIFDPPYLSDTSRKVASIMDSRFGSYGSEAEARATVQAGAREAWRVARLGVIAKVQDHCHGSRKVWMSRWVQDAIPAEPFDSLHLMSPSKVRDPKWNGSQLTVWSNNTTFWIWRKDGPVHKRRRTAAPGFAEAAL